MKKKKTLAAILAAATTLAITPVAAMADQEEGLSSYYNYELATNEMETFCIQHTQYAKELNVLTNCIDGLLGVDASGKIIPAVAKEWGTDDDGKTWTFKRRAMSRSYQKMRTMNILTS